MTRQAIVALLKRICKLLFPALMDRHGKAAVNVSKYQPLTSGWKSVRLDRSVSVSGTTLLETHWDDDLINEQHRRFHSVTLSEGPA